MARKTLPANVVGPAVRKARNQMDLTQEQFAAQCQLAGLDISRATLAQIEARIRYVSDTELIVLASLLDMTTDALFPPEIRKKLQKKRGTSSFRRSAKK